MSSPKFSKKHYEKLAINLSGLNVNETINYLILTSIADMLEEDNPRFDRSRFIKFWMEERNDKNIKRY